MKRVFELILYVFAMTYSLLRFVVDKIGSKASAVIGAFLVILGVLMSLTIIGAIVGIPLILLGAALFAIALWRRK